MLPRLGYCVKQELDHSSTVVEVRWVTTIPSIVGFHVVKYMYMELYVSEVNLIAVNWNVFEFCPAKLAGKNLQPLFMFYVWQYHKTSLSNKDTNTNLNTV